MGSEEHTLFLRSERCGKSPQLREQALNRGSTKAGLAKICFHGDSVPWFVACGLRLFSQQLFSFGAGEGSLSPGFLTTSARDRRGSESERPTTRPYHKLGSWGRTEAEGFSRELVWRVGAEGFSRELAEWVRAESFSRELRKGERAGRKHKIRSSEAPCLC